MARNLGTKEENKMVIEMYKRGYNTREIATKLNRSYCFVHTRIEKYRMEQRRL